MSLHYQMSNSDLGLCMECGLVIDGGEQGCVSYTEAALKQLHMQKVKRSLIDLYFLSYQLQHYVHFAIDEATAVATLMRIGTYLVHNRSRKYASNQQEVVDFLLANDFQFKPVLSSVFIVAIMDAATPESVQTLMRQYMHDVWEVYAPLHEKLLDS